jgi:hypothetical protein
VGKVQNVMETNRKKHKNSQQWQFNTALYTVLACKQTLRERTSAVKHQNWDSAPLHKLIKNFPLFSRPLA